MKIRVLFRKHQSLILCYLIALLLFVGISIYRPGFATPNHIRVLAREAAVIGVVAIGQTFVIITGGIDLSVAWMICVSAILVTRLGGGTNEAMIWSIPLILIMTTFFGLINGICIAYLRMPAIVMTLGMNIILQGGLVAATQGAPGGYASNFLIQIGQSSFLGIPWLVWIWAVLALAAMLLLFKMKYGRELFAIGNNSVVANYSGINVRSVVMWSYGLSGLTAGLAGILLAGRIGSSYLSMGDTLQFQSIAAVAIGGTSMMGGNGNYLGSIAGAFTITILLAILSALNLPYGVQRMAYGLIVLISVLMAAFRGRKLRS